MLAMATARVPLDSLCLRVSLMGLGHPAKILAKARCFPCAAQFLSWATCVCSKVTLLCIGFYYTQTHAKAWFSAGLRKWRSFISSWSFGPNLSKWRDMRYILSCSVVAFLIQELDGSYIQGNLQIRTSWILSSPWMWPSWVLHDVAI